MEFNGAWSKVSSDHEMSLFALLFSFILVLAESMEFGRASGYGFSQLFFLLLLLFATALLRQTGIYCCLHEGAEQVWNGYRD